MARTRTPIVTTEREAGQPSGPGEFLLGAIGSSFLGWLASGISPVIAGLLWTAAGVLLIVTIIAFGVRAGRASSSVTTPTGEQR